MCDHLHASDFDCKEDELANEASKLAMKMNLSNEEIEFLDSVVTLYGSKSQNQLIFMTHSEQPWVEQREGLSPFDYSNREISLDTMYSYYKARYDKNHKEA